MIDWQQVYSGLYAGGRYGTNTNRLQEAVELTQKWPKGSLLDISTGWGWYLDQMAERGFDVKGTELVPTLCDGKRVVQAEIDQDGLRFQDNSFDYVTCWDVLEHLEAPLDLMVLGEMRRIARNGVAVSVNNKHPSKWGAKIGTELHINIRPYEEWEALVRELFAGWEVSYYGELRSPIILCENV